MKTEIEVINKQAVEGKRGGGTGRPRRGRMGVILSSRPCLFCFFFFVFLKHSVTEIHFAQKRSVQSATLTGRKSKRSDGGSRRGR